MKSPLFSIVLPSYNRAHFISKAIVSVLQQQYQDWELIIIDDGSTDNTREVVSGFTDKRISYHWQTNQERSAARNAGINLAAGEFVCFIDSDDLWRSNHLQVLFDTMKSRQYERAFYFTGMTWHFPDRKNDVLFATIADRNLVEFVIGNQIGTPTVCIHHSILQKEKFNTSLRINEDVELYARIVAKYPLVQIQVCTVDVLIHNENTQATEKNYLVPQIKALTTIFSNPELKGKISETYKTNRLQDLRHRLIHSYLQNREYAQMNKEIIRFLILYPGHYQNKAKIVLLLYHLPGGRIIQKFVQWVKTH